MRWVRSALLFGLSLLTAVAHEIPNDLVIQGFVRPSGQTLRVLLRVPLNALRDTQFPQTAAGNLDIASSGKLLADATQVWIADNVTVCEAEEQLPHLKVTSLRVSLPSDRSFTSFDEALAHLAAPQQETALVWNQALLDVAMETPIASSASRFSLRSALARLGVRTVTVLRYQMPGGAERVFELEGDPGLVQLDPSWTQAARRFVWSGFEHILGGVDHLLFLACLVVPLRSLRALIPVVTAFTVAHSVTLAAAAYGFAPDALWFPPLVETLIAISIVYMALENLVDAAEQREVSLPRRWTVAFGFGLVHGFGFSFALRQTLQFAGAHLLTSLVSFNLGVELGQLAVLLLMLPALGLLFRYLVSERLGVIIMSAFIAHTGWHWTMERGGELAQYRWEWPALDAAFFAMAFRWAFWMLLAAALAWSAPQLWRRLAHRMNQILR